MPLDANDQTDLRIFMDRFTRFEAALAPQMRRIEEYLDKVDTNTHDIERLKKGESGQNDAIKSVTDFMLETRATTKASIRNAYWGFTILALVVSTGINIWGIFFGAKK